MTPGPVSPRPDRRSAIFGAPDPKRGPHLFRNSRPPVSSSHLHPSEDWYASFSQDVLYDRILESRSVVIKVQEILILLQAEALQAVGIGKLAQDAELLRLEGSLKFVRRCHEGHGRIIPTEMSLRRVG
jgi:hypothetical protein